MQRKLNQKVIKDLCGTVSFKRGVSYFQTKKVSILEYNGEICKGIVHGTEDFEVIIDMSARDIKTTCSCQVLFDFNKSCQHVAAVLIAIIEMDQDNQLNHKNEKDSTGKGELTNDFLALFQDRSVNKSGHQLYFEKREALPISFKLIPIETSNEEYLFGIQIRVDTYPVLNMNDFLNDISSRKSSPLSSSFIYNPNLHCFLSEDDFILHQLIQIARDKELFIETFSMESKSGIGKDLLIIPPTAWMNLLPLLKRASNVVLEVNGEELRFHYLEGPPPVQFFLQDADNGNYRLRVDGLDEMMLLTGYYSVLVKENLYSLNSSDFERLYEVKRMFKEPSRKEIHILNDQLHVFLKEVVPRLKKIGKVQLSKSINEILMKKPLIAKLYLDRVRNRLLCGLEFHYENIVIQPLEERENVTGPYVVRDMEKEEKILKMMDDAGFTKTEGGYFMQNEELEFDFLYYTVPKLQKFVQIYATTAVRNRVVSSSQHPIIRVKAHKERMNWLQFKFEMEGFSEKQVKEILKSLEFKRKYYRLPNGSLLSLRTREMEAIRKFLNEQPRSNDDYQLTLDRPILESLKFLELIQESEIFQPEESFRKVINQLLNPGQLEFEVPKRLSAILREYQVAGFKWMKQLASYGFGGVLADDMGLGKTIQSIAFILSELKEIRDQRKPAFIVCPSSLTYNWLNEFTRFAPELQATIIDGSKRERKELLQQAFEMDVIITSYPLLRQDVILYKDFHFHTIIFDEAQAFKNPFTQTARAVKKLKANHRFGLTGNPIENSLEELWSIYHVIFPQLFQGLEDFSHLRRKDVAKRVRPFLLRRVKEDVLGELPKKEEILQMSELLPDQKKLYTALLAKLREETLKHLDKDTLQKNKIRILAGLTRLRQICCHPALFVEGYQGSSAKFEQLMEILEESRVSGRRVLIFSQFTKMLEIIGRELMNKGQNYFYLDGQTPSAERVELCQRFNEGERDMFLISLKAGGTGLNLTGADTVILYDLWWNPAVEEQAMDRAHRMGQKNTVQVIKLVARGTIEEKINELQEKKRLLIADILDVGETSGLTEDDIREILMI